MNNSPILTCTLLMSLIMSLCFCQTTNAQVSNLDSLRVVFYNLLNFPDPNPPGKEDTLLAIMDHLQADLLLVCELKSSAGAQLILDNALNADGIVRWRKADFTGNTSSGADLQQLAFYNQNKLSLYSQDVIQTHVRDINEYIFFLRDPFLGGHMDTTWLDVYVTHLKAGDSDSDRSDRSRMADSLRNYLNGRPPNRNVIFAGDLNLYRSTEEAYNTITEDGSDNVLKDPINTPGSWNSSATFADVHTQSTRTSSIFGDGSGGGLDSRFDFILLSENMLFDANRLSYVEDSYIAFGNDGSCYNQQIRDCSAVSDRLNTALYYMSDHIPVVLDLAASYPIFSGIEEADNKVLKVWSSEGHIHLLSEVFTGQVELSIVALSGAVLHKKQLLVESGANYFQLPFEISAGIYLVQIKPLSRGNQPTFLPQTSKLFIQNR